MDQPGRCKRTDGKRWRCTKDAIPNEKYCQTHMHRGCRRSRKLVESSIADLNLRLKMQQPSADATTDKTANDAVLKIDHSSEDPCSRMTKIPASKMEGKQLLPSAEGKERLKIEANNKVHTISLEFSPKSVLGQGELAEETKRCRRTDGKRWRCSKEVIGEDRKYCASHMYRGAKKRPHSQQQGEEECNPFALVKRADKLMLGFDNNLASSS